MVRGTNSSSFWRKCEAPQQQQAEDIARLLSLKLADVTPDMLDAAVLRELRARLNMTQREFGKLLAPSGVGAVSPSVICGFEKALQPVPRLLIARAVDVTASIQAFALWLCQQDQQNGAGGADELERMCVKLKQLGPGCIMLLQPYQESRSGFLRVDELSAVRAFLSLVNERKVTTGAGSRPGARGPYKQGAKGKRNEKGEPRAESPYAVSTICAVTAISRDATIKPKSVSIIATRPLHPLDNRLTNGTPLVGYEDLSGRSCSSSDGPTGVVDLRDADALSIRTCAPSERSSSPSETAIPKSLSSCSPAWSFNSDSGTGTCAPSERSSSPSEKAVPKSLASCSPMSSFNSDSGVSSCSEVSGVARPRSPTHDQPGRGGTPRSDAAADFLLRLQEAESRDAGTMVALKTLQEEQSARIMHLSKRRPTVGSKGNPCFVDPIKQLNDAGTDSWLKRRPTVSSKGKPCDVFPPKQLDEAGTDGWSKRLPTEGSEGNACVVDPPKQLDEAGTDGWFNLSDLAQPNVIQASSLLDMGSTDLSISELSLNKSQLNVAEIFDTYVGHDELIAVGEI